MREKRDKNFLWLNIYIKNRWCLISVTCLVSIKRFIGEKKLYCIASDVYVYWLCWEESESGNATQERWHVSSERMDVSYHQFFFLVHMK